MPYEYSSVALSPEHFNYDCADAVLCEPAYNSSSSSSVVVNTVFVCAIRRKTSARIAELEDAAEQARNRASKFEKEKIKLQIEIRDLSVELETVNSCIILLLLKHISIFRFTNIHYHS